LKYEERVTAVEIFMWWLDLDLACKEWLRENLRATELPVEVVQGIAAAGGPGPDDVVVVVLTEADWDFIETQSEFVD
jgi:hypothetical protein